MTEASNIPLLIAHRAKNLPPHQAEPMIRDALSSYPASPVLWERLTHILLTLRRTREALAATQELHKLVGNSPAYWRLLALVRLDMNSLGEALDAITHLHRQDVRSLLGWRVKAMVLLTMGRMDDALAAVEEIHKRAPDDIAGWKIKQQVHEAMGHEAQAQTIRDNLPLASLLKDMLADRAAPPSA